MSAVRALSQFSGLAGLAKSAVTRRTGALLSRAAVGPCAPVSRMCTAQGVRAFSRTSRVFGSGATDVSLSQRLESEIQYEKEASADVPATPEFLKAFQEQGAWAIEDVIGNDEIVLSRKFGNETIRLMFSIADIQVEEEEGFENPEEGGESEDQGVHEYPIRVSLSLTKSNGPGALNVDMVCQHGHFVTENTSFYSSAQLGTELTAEADWKRRGLYIGPQFDTLDAGVQEELEKFLQERGVNESLALFIPEYAEYKEQQEYVRWLNNVKSFVDL